MSTSISNILNNKFRMTGMATGLDTNSMVESMTKVEKSKIDKVKQDKQLLEWKAEAYKSVTNKLRAFKDEYFDILKSANNFRSSTAFSSKSVTSSDDTVLSAVVGPTATVGNRSVEVLSLASSAKITSSSTVSSGASGVTGVNPVDMSKMKEGKSFKVTLNGVSKVVTLEKDYTNNSVSEFATGMNDQMTSLFGNNKITVTANENNQIVFTPVTASNSLSISDSGNTYIRKLGLEEGQVNYLSSNSMNTFSAGNFNIQIGSDEAKQISIEGAETIEEYVQKINTSFTNNGVSLNVKAVIDSTDQSKINFISLNTSKEITFTDGSTNNILDDFSITSNSKIKEMNGNIDFSVDDKGKDFYITVNGTKKLIDFPGDFSNSVSNDATGKTMQEQIQSQLDSGGLTGITVEITEGKISFTNPQGSLIKIEKGDEGLKEELGFTTNSGSNKMSLNSKLEELSFANGLQFSNNQISFSINGENFTFEKTDTLNSVINTVNNSDANVTMSYDQYNDLFSFESKTQGTVGSVALLDNSGNFISAINMDSEEVYGQDTQIKINGTLMENSKSTFTIDGVTYTPKKTGTVNLNITSDTDGLISKVNSFVTKYNEVTSFINDMSNQKKYRDYTPLTDDQRSSMSDTDITLWETKAKSGLLNGDPILLKISDNMRRAMSDSIKDVSVGLAQIGITTSTYTLKGRLAVNEDKLRKAIDENPNAVSQIFSKQSSLEYTDEKNRSTRYNEEGIANRLYDIIQDSIRTTRGSDNKKGFLIEKAGIDGDTTEFNNTILNQMNEKDDIINELTNKLYTKQEAYYLKFASLEKIIGSMNSQSSWLSQQFSS